MITAIQAGQLAQRTYTDRPTFGAEDSAGRAVVYGETVVGFPGSNNMACWLADLDAIAEHVPGMGMVHSGFWSAFLEIAKPLMALQAVDVVLGHSEGAALALIYAAQRCIIGKPPKAVFAFEPPRISADNIIGSVLKAHGVSVLLTQNGEDVVPMVPRLLEKWQHPAPLTKIGKASDPFPNVADHMMTSVIASLEAMA